MNNKNVLHIITISFVINHFFGNQFNYLKEKTGNQYSLGCTPSDEFENLSKALGYKKFPVEVTRNISPITDLFSIYKTYTYIKKNKITTIVGHTPKGGMVAMIAGFFAGVPERIYFRHGIIYETSSGLKRAILKNIDRLSGKLAKKVVCVSESVREISVRDKLNDPKKNIILGLGTCNGIDTEARYNPNSIGTLEKSKLKNSLDIKDSDIVIGYVGRLVRDKGLNELIEAWEILEQKHNNIKLVLVGPLETKDAIREDTKNKIEKNPNILHTGFVLRSSPFFAIMDIFVLPTYREGFPTVSLEASSMSLPVVITKATGCTEAIIENETGLFTSNNAVDIAEKIDIYINNEDLRKKHGTQGREFVQQNFEQHRVWDLISEKLKY